MLYRYYSKTKQLIRWLPIIWGDEHWDYNYIFKIIKHKLKFTRECMDKGDEDRKSLNKKLKDIHTCELLLDRMAKDAYCEVDYKEQEEKWGQLRFGKKGIYRSKIFTKSDIKQHNRESIELYNKEQYLYKQDMELFTDIFKKHVRSWWE